MPLALIFVPLLGAAIMPILRKIWFKGGPTLVATSVTLYLLGVTSWSAYHGLVSQHSLLLDRLVLGGRVVLNIDGLALMVLLAISLVALMTVLFSIRYPFDPDRRPGYYALILLVVTGMNGLVMATDLFSVFVFLEILSIGSFILIAYQLDQKGIEGAFKYMMLSAVATVFLLLGIALIFAMTGSVNFTDVAAAIKGGGAGIQLTLALVIFALALKAGIMPFHAWLPDAYTAAPAPVSVLLGGIVTKVAGVYTLLRLILSIYGFSQPFTNTILILATISMMLGAFMALGQRDFKRMLAFSSISQIGYIMLGFALGTPLGLLGAVFHFFNHAVFKSLLFLNAGAVELATDTRDFDRLGGLAKRMPVTGVTSIIGFLSAAGIPPMAGFWSKLLIIIALWSAGYHTIALLAIFTSLITLAYLLSLQREVFFGKVRPEMEATVEVAPALYWPAIILATITVLVGVLYPFVIAKLILPANQLLQVLAK